jgi:hypothetical protein
MNRLLFGNNLKWLRDLTEDKPESAARCSPQFCLGLVKSRGRSGIWGVVLIRKASYRMGDINLKADVSAEFTAVMFLAFLFVSRIEIFCLSVVFVEEEIEDDD